MSHEKDQELAQRKMSFFTNISHEIKTPLTLILAPIEKLIKMNEGNHNVQNQLLLMQRNGGLLLRLLNQLLDFRKFESGKMKLQATEENLESFLQEVVTAFESYALHRGISLRLVSQTDHLPVWFDLDKLEKVMYNLLSNALKFTQDGGHVYVRVKTQTWKQNSGILIEVEDDGIGIPAEHISTIFEQFNHHDDSGCNRNGTGIGLAFSKGLVELHRGKITAVSTPGNYDKKGYTCFSVWLPLGKAHLTEEETTADCKEKDRVAFYQELEIQPASAFQSVEKRSVLADSGKDRLIMLIVEDNPGVLDFVAAHFAETFEVHTAMDGLSGWQKATETIPDIIISDVMMPHLSGTDLCSRLKADDRTSHVPVILLTALATQVFEIEGLATGADDYITKPFNLGILEARVWNLLESRKKLRERYRKEINLQPRNIMITSPDERFLEKAMNFIENNMSESSLSVEELGKEVGMSRVTLYRKIKALTGQTAIEFIRNVRLKRAAQLLGQNNLNVSEVAYLVGFTDIDYFRKCFKEQHGHTPKEYAKFTSEK
jgi:DNA-binding response OmpR family regulator